MSWNQVEGKWKQLRGKVKARWGKLRDNDLDVIRGKRDQLVGKLQEIYGIVREKASEQVTQFTESLSARKPGQVVPVRVSKRETTRRGTRARRDCRWAEDRKL